MRKVRGNAGTGRIRCSTSRTTFRSGRALHMLLFSATMIFSAHVALAACPDMTAGAPLLNSCAQPCRTHVDRTIPCTCNHPGNHPGNHPTRCRISLVSLKRMAFTTQNRFEAVSLADPKIAQLAALAAQRFSQTSPHAMVCKQHGRSVQLVGPPKIVSACSQVRSLPAYAAQALISWPGMSLYLKSACLTPWLLSVLARRTSCLTVDSV